MYSFETTIGAGNATVTVEYDAETDCDERGSFTTTDIVNVLYQGKIINDTLTDEVWGELCVKADEDFAESSASDLEAAQITRYVSRQEALGISL